MRLFPTILVVAIAAMSQVAAVDPSPSIDASGVDQFWKTVDLLKSGHNLSKQQWDALFSAAGYAELENDLHRRSTYELLLRIAFEAPAENELDNEEAARIVRHLKQACNCRDRIQTFVKTAAQSEWVKQAVGNAQKYLPAHLTDSTPPPPVKLVVLYPGGRSCPDGVVFDAYFLSFSSSPDKWLGHEFHHFFRRQLQCMDSSKIKGDDSKLLATLERLELDGIADLIDKQALAFGSDDDLRLEMTNLDLRSVRDQTRKVLSQFPQLIAKIDAALKAFDEHPSDSALIGANLERSLPWMAKQTTGMSMAMRIEEQFGRDRLISTVGNPFAFLRLYQDAANRLNRPGECPGFSAQAMSAIAALEKEYAGLPVVR